MTPIELELKDIFALSGVFNAAFAAILGLFVFVKNSKKRNNQIFFVMSLFIVIWSLGYAVFLFADTEHVAWIGIRTLVAGSTFIPVLYLHWTMNLLEEDQAHSWLLWAGYAATFLFAILSLSPGYILSVESKLFFPFWPNGTIYYFLYIAVVYVGLFVTALYWQIHHLLKLSSSKKNQIRFIFVGSLIAALGGMTNFLLWFDVPIPPVGNFVVNVYVFLFAWSIIRYGSLEVPVLITKRNIVQLITWSIFCVLLSLALIVWYVDLPVIWKVLFVVLVGFCILNLRQATLTLVEKTILTDFFDTRWGVSPDGTNDQILRIFHEVKTFMKKFSSSISVDMLFYDDRLGYYRSVQSNGLDVSIASSDPLFAFVRSIKGVCFVEDVQLDRLVDQSTAKIILAKLRRFRADVVIPMRHWTHEVVLVAFVRCESMTLEQKMKLKQYLMFREPKWDEIASRIYTNKRALESLKRVAP